MTVRILSRSPATFFLTALLVLSTSISIGQPRIPRDKKPVEIPPLTTTETHPTNWEIVKSISQISGKSVSTVKNIHYAIEDIEQEFGIPVSLTWALVWVESGKLNSELARKGNNYTGMKAKPDWTGPSLCNDHLEYFSSKKEWKSQEACFKIYSDVDESLQDFAKHLKSKRWYADAFQCDSDDLECWIEGLSKEHDRHNIGYATDPDWDDKIIRVMNEYDFIHFK